MKVDKIAFMIPNSAWFDKRYWHNFPYTVGLLVAVLRKGGYNADVIDANLDNLTEDQLAAAVERLKPDLVCVSAMTVEYRASVHQTFKVVKQVNPKIVTIIGGVYPTLSPEIVKKDPNIDYIVIGEGEERLPALIEAIRADRGFDKVDGLMYRVNGEYTAVPLKGRVEDLNALPFPDYSPFDMKRYMNYGHKYTQNFNFKYMPWAETITSRGCPYHCIFCASNRVYGLPIRYRSAENVLQEVDMLVQQYGAREIIFVDDSFLQSKKRAMQICQGLVDRKYDLAWKSNNLAIFHMDAPLLEMMKKSGCYQVSVSIESGSQKTLRMIKKPINLKAIGPVIEKIKELDIELISNYVIGFPGETWDDIRECIRYAESIDIDYTLFSIATPLPATELYDACVRDHLIPDDFSFENFNYYGFGRGVITTKEWTPFELQVLRAFEWDRINFKTQAKKEKICKMLGITLQELEDWRRETRQRLGVEVQAADKAVH